MHISVAETTEEIQGTPLPELILLDLDHWRPPSLEILKWLRSQKPYARIPVIALTSAGATDRVSRAYELGANSCVMKHENGGLIEDVARGIGSYAKVLQLHRQTA
jgi:DNA-binding response OmpR family regulator